MPDLENLELRVKQIEERNKNVEAGKAWETSLTRRGLIALFTYLAISLYLQAIDVPNPWLSAIVPTIGFLLSTLTLPFFKDWWMKNIYRK